MAARLQSPPRGASDHESESAGKPGSRRRARRRVRGRRARGRLTRGNVDDRDPVEPRRGGARLPRPRARRLGLVHGDAPERRAGAARARDGRGRGASRRLRIGGHRRSARGRGRRLARRPLHVGRVLARLGRRSRGLTRSARAPGQRGRRDRRRERSPVPGRRGDLERPQDREHRGLHLGRRLLRAASRRRGDRARASRGRGSSDPRLGRLAQIGSAHRTPARRRSRRRLVQRARAPDARRHGRRGRGRASRRQDAAGRRCR